jgi:hypothetical protein
MKWIVILCACPVLSSTACPAVLCTVPQVQRRYDTNDSKPEAQNAAGRAI